MLRLLHLHGDGGGLPLLRGGRRGEKIRSDERSGMRGGKATTVRGRAAGGSGGN